MIDDPKLEQLIKVTAQAAKNKETEESALEAAKARLPQMDKVAEDAATAYEAALNELGQHIKTNL